MRSAQHECGVFGLYLNEKGREAAIQGYIEPLQMSYDVLDTQRHRGDQSTGLASFEEWSGFL